MDKSDRLASSQKRKCPVCCQQLPTQHTTTDVALYVRETGNLIMSTQQTCIKCKEQMIKIRKYVDEESLCFGKDSQIFKALLEPLLTEKSLMQTYETSIYQKYVEIQIKRNKLYHCSHLPQNCRQLVYYSSFSVHQAERNQRIKNTISRIMQIAAIPFNNIKDISVLVQCLCCYMHENNVLRLFKLISDLSLKNVKIFPESDEEEPYDTLYNKLYQNNEIQKVIICIWALINSWEAFPMLLQKIKSDRKDPDLLKLKKVVLASKKQDQTMNGFQCQNCEFNKIKNLEEITKMRNNFVIIWKELKKQENTIKQQINQMQLKFYKQKEEFINKIIKLKDKIDLLEGKQIQGRPRSASFSNVYEKGQSKYKKLSSSLIKQVSEKSQSTIKTQLKIQENRYTVDEIQEPRKYQMKSLHLLLSYLPQFDPSFFSEEASQQLIIQTIEKGMKKMAQDIVIFQKKSKTYENDSKRLLEILTRKQERFVPLIHEKDDIIERYENALWKMENNLPVEDQILAPRIEGIINVFRSNFKEQMTEMTECMEEQKKVNGSQTSPKKKKKKSSAKKPKKEVVEEKQCSIY